MRGQNICTRLLHLCSCNMIMFWKSWILNFSTHLPDSGVWGSAGTIFATMLLHSKFLLIGYATWPCSEKKFNLTCWPLRSSGRGLRAKYLIPCYWICISMVCFNMKHFVSQLPLISYNKLYIKDLSLLCIAILKLFYDRKLIEGETVTAFGWDLKRLALKAYLTN